MYIIPIAPVSPHVLGYILVTELTTSFSKKKIHLQCLKKTEGRLKALTATLNVSLGSPKSLLTIWMIKYEVYL